MGYVRPPWIVLFLLVFNLGCGATKVVTRIATGTAKGAGKTTKMATKGAIKVGKGVVGVATAPFRDDESE